MKISNNQSLKTNIAESVRSKNPWHAYVDGSYSVRCPEGVAIGIAMIDNLGNKYKCSKFYVSPELATHRNVGAEVLAAYIAARVAVKMNCKHLVIHYDYSGIGNWMNGSWSANTEMSKTYVKEMNKMKELINISFKYVRGHSGNRWNDAADKFANEAIANRING